MKMKKLLREIIFPIFLVFFVPLTLFAQNKTVTGKVISQSGNAPLIGVSVQLKGSKSGTSTDNSGSYSISVPANNAVLVFSYVGFVNSEVVVGDKSVINVSLAESTDKLSDIVVVGYGTQKKREVTSAVTTVNAEQFNKGNISDVAQLLQGKVAGLSISRAGGNPNGGFDIRLRGLSTLGAGTSPLIVLDGQVGADLNTVDPNDIASISVLKDGSSAAIYGTRGSAGVIIITTKKGAPNSSSVSYNGSVTAENAARLTKHMSAAEFRNLIKTTGIGTDYGATTDWYKEITRTGLSHQHNLSFSGGTGHTTYNASLNFRNTEGIAITTGFQQLNGRVSLTHKALNDKLVFNFELSTTRKHSDFGFDNAFEYAVIYNPTSPIHARTPSEDLAGGGYFEVSNTEYSNPVAVLKQNSNQGDLKRFNLSGSAEYEIARGLKFLVRYAQQTSSNYQQQYSPSNAFIDRGFYGGFTGVGKHGYSYKQDDETFSQLYENTLSYTKTVKGLEVSAIGGYSYQDFLYQGYSVGAGNFITDLTGQNFGTAQDAGNGLAQLSSYKNANKLVAFFGRLNLNYKNMAFLQASLRREGSSEFGTNNKWGYFPAVSAGVDLKKVFSVPSFSTLKLRGSYGVTGSLPPSPYLSQLLFSGVGTYLINGQWITTFGPTQNPNPDLKWEKKAETDIGLDFTAFNGRLNGTLDYYNRTTSDLIFNVTVPAPPALFNKEWKNIGELTSHGFEVALNYDVVKKKDITWNTGINFSTFSVVLTKLDPSLKGQYVGATNLGSPGQEATEITRSLEGQPIGQFYNAVFRGYDKDGHYLLDDGKGNAMVAKDEIAGPNYKTFIGNGLPKWEAGWTNSFSYKRWDLNFFFRGSFGHDIINTFRAFYENPTVSSAYNMVNTKYFNPALRDGQIFSSLFVEKGDFVKLDNATLAYTFPVTGKAVRSIKAFVTGRNLLTITGYTGADPEVRYQDGGNVLAPGVDRRASWVLARSFTLGVNVAF
jgi:TonB-linked SusC/RagA family outer membrane protein